MGDDLGEKKESVFIGVSPTDKAESILHQNI